MTSTVFVLNTEICLSPPLKAIRSKNGAAGSRQFLALFESLHRELPIRRVIVGPSRNQDKNFTKALELLGSEIKIERSDTPFIEERQWQSRGMRKTPAENQNVDHKEQPSRRLTSFSSSPALPRSLRRRW
jgi:hypothetical protein